MQNLRTHSISHFHTGLHPLTQQGLTIFEAPTGARQLLLASATSANALTLFGQYLPPSTSKNLTELPISTALNSSPAALCIVDGLVLLATCAGELFSIDPKSGSIDPVGEIVDEHDSSHSGVLTACPSPDGNVVVLVSPVKTLVLDAALDLSAELPHSDGVAHSAVVSWRADGEFFVVALEGRDGTLSGIVVDRECANVKRLDLSDVQKRAEDGGQLLIAWEPRVGGFICMSTGAERLIFFERNGLRHLRSDFSLPRGRSPTILSWSADSRMLAVVQIEEGRVSTVCIFMRCNYRWYCKKVIRVKGIVVLVHWDEDIAGAMTVFTKDGFALFLRFRTVPGSVFNFSSGTHAFVVDGHNVCVTNFSHAILPPPMNHGVLEFHDAVENVCAWAADDQIGAMLSDGSFELMSVGKEFRRAQVDCSPKSNVKVPLKTNRWILDTETLSNEFMFLRSPVLIAGDALVVIDHSTAWSLENGESPDILRLYHLDSRRSAASCIGEYMVNGCVRALSRSMRANSLVLVTSKGCIVRLEVDLESGEFTEMISAANAVSEEVILVCDVMISNGRCLTLTLDDTGVLKLFELSSEKRLFVSKECTSFCLQEGFLSFTIQSHLMYCALLDSAQSKSYDGDRSNIPSLADSLDGATEGVKFDNHGSHLSDGKGATRPIDRGSVIVTALPKDVAVVLQAPRGNLETICLRPVVFEAVDKLAKRAEYAKGFSLCRKQRVDMNHLVDADYGLFLENVQKFVGEVDKASHLSIFMTFLRGESSRVNAVCSAIVGSLVEKTNSGQFINAILTGLIRREPSDLGGALDHVRLARNRNVEEGTAALDYLFVLIKDEKKVYGEALGTYDLELALFVARASEMDPAEYSQELKGLSLLDLQTRKYTIDMRLKRYARALRHLHACGEQKYDECVALCHEHALYEVALDLFLDSQAYRADLLNGFGKHLHASNRFEEAGAIFIHNGDLEQACSSYRSGGMWQLAASTAWRCEELSIEKKRALLESIADELIENRKMKEAAHVRLAHLDDIDGAIELLSGEWDEMFEAVGIYCAPRIASNKDGERIRTQELWGKVVGLVVGGAEEILVTIAENRGKLHERRKRLETVRAVKREISSRLAAKGLGGDEADSDMFSASTASSLASNLSDVTFTSRTSATSVYTSATNTGPMSAAKLEKQAEKRRRKSARKRIREGHPREEEYLVGYLKKLVPNAFLRQRVRKVTSALVFIGRLDVVVKLVKAMTEFVEETRQLPDDVLDGEELRESISDRSWMEPAKNVELLHNAVLDLR